jgi:hypothetical protein
MEIRQAPPSNPFVVDLPLGPRTVPGPRFDAPPVRRREPQSREKTKRDPRFMSLKVVPSIGAVPSDGRALTFEAPHFGRPNQEQEALTGERTSRS